MKDAFGLVAIVALMPLITIQIIGAVYKYKSMLVENEKQAAIDDEIIVFKRKMSSAQVESN